jgi:uncharacterized membrane protein YheB (UPF0754 family)
MHNLIWFTPVVTGLIGWITNWLAIKMLFKPRKPLWVLGINFQGLIPKRQAELAVQTAQIVEKELLHQHLVTDAIKSVDIKPLIEESVTRLIEEKLAGKLRQIPMLGALINEAAIKSIKDVAVKEMLVESKFILDRFASDIEGKFHIQSIIQKKVEEFELDKLEEIVMSVSKKEFKLIEFIGAFLGFIIGVLQLFVLKLL